MVAQTVLFATVCHISLIHFIPSNFALKMACPQKPFGCVTMQCTAIFLSQKIRPGIPLLGENLTRKFSNFFVRVLLHTSD